MEQAQRYAIELVKTYAFIEAAYFEKYQPTTFYLEKIDERISPFILEWFQMPFLPLAQMVILYDYFMGRYGTPAKKISGQKWEKYFNHELKDQDNTTLQSHIAEIVKSAYGIKEGQKIRARALALVNSKAIGGYTGSIPDVYKAIQKIIENPQEMPNLFFSESNPYDDLLTLESELFELWSLHDIKLYLKTWSYVDIRKFLRKPLRSQNFDKEKVQVTITNEVLKIPREEEEKLSGIDSFINVFKNQPSGEIWQAILKRVLAAIQQEIPTAMNQEVPAGGYADISNRGHFDQILPSNLVYPEEEFLRRFIEGELLFYEREAPPAPTPPEQWIFLDNSPLTWGIPRVAASAHAINIINKSLETGSQVHVLAAGRLGQPFENLNLASGIQELLDYRRWFFEIKRELLQFFNFLKKDGRQKTYDVHICSEAGNKAIILKQILKAKLPQNFRVYVFLVDAITAQATLYKRHHDMLQERFSVSLALKDLTISKEASSSGKAAMYSVYPQMLWDFNSDPLCANIDNHGTTVSGHQNGEIHLWDAAHGNHLGQVACFAKAILEIAIFENHIIFVTKENVFHLDLFKGTATNLKYPREIKGCIRHGWVLGTFFWFTTADTLVQYNVVTRKINTYDHCHKTPYLPFFVCNQTQQIFWKNGSKEISFDLHSKKESYMANYIGHNFLDNHCRNSVVDCNNSIIAYTSGGTPSAKLNWLSNKHHEIKMEIKGSQWAKALHTKHERLVAANSNSIWFWSLKTGTLLKKCSGMVHKIKRISWIASKKNNTHGIKIDIYTVPFVLYWDENQIGFSQLNAWLAPGCFRDKFNDKIEYEILVADEKDTKEKQKYLGNIYHRSSSHKNSITHSLLVGKWLVVCYNNRKLEFYSPNDKEPSVFFWFKSGNFWAIASKDGLAAGPEKGSIHFPQGISLRSSSEATLGKMLNKGSNLQ